MNRNDSVLTYRIDPALQARISLSNRSRLRVAPQRLDGVTSTLARSHAERTRFLEDPAAFLSAQAIPVTSCNLLSRTTGLQRTTETGTTALSVAYVCCDVTSTSFIYCTVFVGIDCLARVLSVIAAAGSGPLAENESRTSLVDVL